jgi:hypothetical protein
VIPYPEGSEASEGPKNENTKSPIVATGENHRIRRGRRGVQPPGDPQATLVNKAENTTAKIPPSRNIEKTEPPDASGGQPDDANKSSGSGPVPDPPTSRILTAEEAARRFLNGGIQND